MSAGRWEWRGIDLMWFCNGCAGSPQGNHPSVSRCLCGDTRPDRDVPSPEGDAFRAAVEAVLNDVGEMLVRKNDAYGNSALSPLRVFSQADPIEQIKVRIDDKLSRLARGRAAGEDVVADLLGYLVLLQIAQKHADAVVL